MPLPMTSAETTGRLRSSGKTQSNLEFVNSQYWRNHQAAKSGVENELLAAVKQNGLAFQYLNKDRGTYHIVYMQ